MTKRRDGMEHFVPTPKQAKAMRGQLLEDIHADPNSGVAKIIDEGLKRKTRTHAEISAMLESGNRIYDACYIAPGERALIMQALKYYVSQQHVMISSAHAKYAPGIRGVWREKNRALFEDQKAHHLKRVAAADAVLNRFIDRSVLRDPRVHDGRGTELSYCKVCKSAPGEPCHRSMKEITGGVM